MARTTGSNGALSSSALRLAAIDLIFERGYIALSMRELAASCGLQPASIYNHYASKQDLLFQIMLAVMRDVRTQASEILGPEGDCVSQARAFVDWHFSFHVARMKEASIGNRELGNLEPENFAQLRELRDEYEHTIRTWIQRGVKAKVFRAPNVKLTAFWLISALNGLWIWYKPNGALSKNQLITIHQDLVLQTLGYSPARV